MLFVNLVPFPYELIPLAQKDFQSFSDLESFKVSLIDAVLSTRHAYSRTCTAIDEVQFFIEVEK